MYRVNSIILVIFITLVNLSCIRYSSGIEDVLKLAGNNRKELENVLKHYNRNPSDSLKLRAAQFLIVNIPGKYSEYFDVPWNDVATVFLRWTSSSDKRLVLDTYQMGEPVKKDDVTHITAEYLINNIELAFKVWQEMPWGKDIPFDAFCEEILPYRVSTEPLENWRGKALASFADLYKSFKKDTAITAVEACSKVNDKLPRFRVDKDFPPMSYTQLMATARGSCESMSALAVFVMRSLGIPVTCDYTPLWVELPNGHTWNSVRDRTGSHISFMGTETNPGKLHQGTYFLRKNKVYRHVYACQQNVPPGKDNIPPLLQDINSMIDVTCEYEQCADVYVNLMNGHFNRNEYAYLSISQGINWHPISWGTVVGDSIQFQSVSKENLYLPVYYHNYQQMPIGYPFWLSEDGSYRFLSNDSSRCELMTFTEIDREVTDYINRMLYGRFEGANRSDFSDATLLYTY